MSEVMRQIRDDEPLMVAWKAYLQTPEYSNSRKWAEFVVLSNKEDIQALAVDHPHLSGSMWTAFMAGWKAAGGKLDDK